MKHLSGLDASFLHLETPEMPMHVGALHLFELPAALHGDYIDIPPARRKSRPSAAA